jgi:hypothetical protein
MSFWETLRGSRELYETMLETVLGEENRDLIRVDDATYDAFRPKAQVKLGGSLRRAPKGITEDAMVKRIDDAGSLLCEAMEPGNLDHTGKGTAKYELSFCPHWNGGIHKKRGDDENAKSHFENAIKLLEESAEHSRFDPQMPAVFQARIRRAAILIEEQALLHPEWEPLRAELAEIRGKLDSDHHGAEGGENQMSWEGRFYLSACDRLAQVLKAMASTETRADVLQAMNTHPFLEDWAGGPDALREWRTENIDAAE